MFAQLGAHQVLFFLIKFQFLATSPYVSIIASQTFSWKSKGDLIQHLVPLFSFSPPSVSLSLSLLSPLSSTHSQSEPVTKAPSLRLHTPGCIHSLGLQALRAPSEFKAHFHSCWTSLCRNQQIDGNPTSVHQIYSGLYSHFAAPERTASFAFRQAWDAKREIHWREGGGR